MPMHCVVYGAKTCPQLALGFDVATLENSFAQVWQLLDWYEEED